MTRRIRFDIITIFPRIFDSYLRESFIARARKSNILDIRVHDLRDFSSGRHKKARPERQGYRGGRVDDRPFGGGPGMVVQIEPVYRAVQFVKSKLKNPSLAQAAAGRQKSKFRERVILFSTRGKKFDAKTAQRLSKYDELILICGRYEGVDERVASHVADEEISMGEYVLSGGELPALLIIEAVSRFIPGFLGKSESLEEVKGSYPVYSRPESFSPKKGLTWNVPKVLTSGDHRKILAWRRRR